MVGRRHGTDFQNLHRNKRAIQLDFKSGAGHAVFQRLVERADVLVENMRPQVKHRLKIGWDDVKKINPRLVYGSISGFGQTGPYSDRGGVDQIAQGMGGLMSITGMPGTGPVRVGIPINDLVAGTLLAFGISTALFERSRTGKGRWVHTSLLETQIFLLDFQASRYLMKGEVAKQTGNDHPTMTPSGVFPTSDGYMNIAASSGGCSSGCATLSKSPNGRQAGVGNGDRANRQDRAAFNAALAEVIKAKADRLLGRRIRRSGHTGGPDQHDRQGVRGSAGAASRHRRAGPKPALRRHADRRVGAQFPRRAERDSHPDAGGRRAHGGNSGLARLFQGGNGTDARSGCYSTRKEHRLRQLATETHGSTRNKKR